MRVDEQEADWTVLEIDGVESAIKSTVARFIWAWEWLEPRREDIEQEARTLVVTRLDLREAAARLATDPGLLAYRLRADLKDAYKAHEHTINEKERPLEPWSEIEQAWVPLAETILLAEAHTSTSDTYAEGEIRTLLPLAFDASYSYPNCHPTDRGSSPQRLQHPSAVADVAKAWHGTALTSKRKQALLLWAMGFSQTESADLLGVTQPAIHKRLASGLAGMLGYLNGQAATHEAATLRPALSA